MKRKVMLFCCFTAAICLVGCNKGPKEDVNQDTINTPTATPEVTVTPTPTPPNEAMEIVESVYDIVKDTNLDTKETGYDISLTLSTSFSKTDHFDATFETIQIDAFFDAIEDKLSTKVKLSVDEQQILKAMVYMTSKDIYYAVSEYGPTFAKVSLSELTDEEALLQSTNITSTKSIADVLNALYESITPDMTFTENYTIRSNGYVVVGTKYQLEIDTVKVKENLEIESENSEFDIFVLEYVDGRDNTFSVKLYPKDNPNLSMVLIMEANKGGLYVSSIDEEKSDDKNTVYKEDLFLSIHKKTGNITSLVLNNGMSTTIDCKMENGVLHTSLYMDSGELHVSFSKIDKTYKATGSYVNSVEIGKDANFSVELQENEVRATAKFLEEKIPYLNLACKIVNRKAESFKLPTSTISAEKWSETFDSESLIEDLERIME